MNYIHFDNPELGFYLLLVIIASVGYGLVKFFISIGKMGKLSTYPQVQVGKKFEWRVTSLNPFEQDAVSVVEVIELKENSDGDGYVRYRSGDTIYSEPIYDFVTKYSKEV
jgi:hypothetical protein